MRAQRSEVRELPVLILGYPATVSRMPQTDRRTTSSSEFVNHLRHASPSGTPGAASGRTKVIGHYRMEAQLKTDHETCHIHVHIYHIMLNKRLSANMYVVTVA